jgi:hypothetical protein
MGWLGHVEGSGSGLWDGPALENSCLVEATCFGVGLEAGPGLDTAGTETRTLLSHPHNLEAVLAVGILRGAEPLSEPGPAGILSSRRLELASLPWHCLHNTLGKCF